MEYHTIDEKLLLDIFRISSPSGKEAGMRKFIRDFLDINGVEYTEDTKGNIFNLSNKEKPLLSAHMDTVEKQFDTSLMKFVNIRTYKNKKFLRGYGIIGGDDKCGIYIILKILESKPDFNFIFSVSEENGLLGIIEVVTKQDFSNVSYGLVLDRRGNKDIICVDNGFGVKAFEDELKSIGKDFGYEAIRGGTSDANQIKSKISCANLSCGYYNSHTEKEYVSLEDLARAYSYVEKIITTVTKKFDKPISSTSTYSSYDYSNTRDSTYCSACYGTKPAGTPMVYVTQYYKVCPECFRKAMFGILEKDKVSNPQINKMVQDFMKKAEDIKFNTMIALPDNSTKALPKTENNVFINGGYSDDSLCGYD